MDKLSVRICQILVKQFNVFVHPRPNVERRGVAQGSPVLQLSAGGERGAFALLSWNTIEPVIALRSFVGYRVLSNYSLLTNYFSQ